MTGHTRQDTSSFQPLLDFPPPEPRWGGLLTEAANERAYGLSGRPADWALPALIVTGPPRCGLTYLAQAWAARFDGTYLPPKAWKRLRRQDIDCLASSHVSVDDAEQPSSQNGDLLVTLLNRSASQGGRVLLLSHRRIETWRTRLADLDSRLHALPAVEIGNPDEALLRRRLIEAAARRFLRLSPDVLAYIVPRLDLSYEAVEKIVEELSALVSTNGRAPSIQLVRAALVANQFGTSGPAEG